MRRKVGADQDLSNAVLGGFLYYQKFEAFT